MSLFISVGNIQINAILKHFIIVPRGLKNDFYLSQFYILKCTNE